MWELIQCSQAAAAARAARKSWSRRSRRSRTAANPSPRPGAGSGALGGMGFHLFGVRGGMCTGYPSCHGMFGFRQPWESSPRAPSLPPCTTFIYSGGFYYDSRTTLGIIRHALHNELWFLSCGQAFIPKGLKLSDIKTAIALVDVTENEWEGEKNSHNNL